MRYHQSEMKNKSFWESYCFFKGKPVNTYNFVKEAFVSGIENIRKAMVRNEFKLWMSSNICFPQNVFCSQSTHSQTHSWNLLTLKQTKQSKVGRDCLQVQPMLSYRCLKGWMLKPYQNCTQRFTQSATQGQDLKSSEVGVGEQGTQNLFVVLLFEPTTQNLSFPAMDSNNFFMARQQQYCNENYIFDALEVGVGEQGEGHNHPLSLGCFW